MKIYKKLLISLAINTALIHYSSGVAMDAEIISQNSSWIKDLVPPAFFSSAEEMKDYGGTLYHLAANGSNAEQILHMARIDPPLRFTPVLESDVEIYTFTRISALVMSHINILEKKGRDDPQEKRIFYEDCINSIQSYFQKFGNLSTYPRNLLPDILFHRSLLNYFLGRSYNGLIAVSSGSPEGKALMPKPIKALKDSLTAAEKLRSIHQSLFSSSLEDLVPDIKFTLLRAYCTQALALSPQEGQHLFFAQARALRKELKGYPELYLDSCQVIEIAETYASALIKTRYKGGGIRVQELKMDKAKEEMIKGYKLAHQLAPSPRYVILEKCRTLSYSLESMTDEAIIAGVKEIEEAIASERQLSCRDDLERVYEYYRKLIQDEQVTIGDLRHYVVAFIRASDLDGAIRRADVLLHLSKNNEKDLFLYRILYAGLKNLKGEPEMWLLLEKELDDKAQEIRDKKEKVKERRRQGKAASISKKLEARRSLQHVPEPEKKVSKALKHKDQASEREPYIASFKESISTQEAKLAKQKRHEEAEKIRTQQAEIKGTVEIASEEEALAPALLNRGEAQEAKLRQLLNSSDLKLQNLYSLSGRPLKVDQEIEEGNWRFTREELQVYFEAMECVYKPTGSSHRKIALPEASYVMQGNDVITIFNDFGGALTLPNWEKDYVPNYLKGQILAARDRLRALKIKALDIQSQS